MLLWNLCFQILCVGEEDIRRVEEVKRHGNGVS